MPGAHKRVTSPLAAAMIVLGLAGLGAGAVAAERSEKGLTLVIPADQASKGTAYHVLPAKDAQVTFISDAPLEHMRAISNKVVGYAVATIDPNGAAPVLHNAEFRLPLNSFDTGLPMRNEHMLSDRWMNAASHPDVVFTVAEFKSPRLASEGEGFRAWAGALVGDMTVKGATKRMEIPATITLFPASDKTKGRAPGDLMSVRADYGVKLADFGVAVGDPAMQSGKVAEEIRLETRLFLSTVSPEVPRAQDEKKPR